MRYTYFEFEKFKGIAKARLDLPDPQSGVRVSALVGLNESGKTTVLQGIDHFQVSSSEEEIRPKQLGGVEAVNAHARIPIADRTNFNGDIRIICQIELDDEDIEAAKDALIAHDGFRLHELTRTITITDNYSYKNSQFEERRRSWANLTGAGMTKRGRTKRSVTSTSDRTRWQIILAALRDRLPPIWYFPNFLFNFPDRIYIEPTDGETDANRFYRALFQDILDALNKDLTIEKHVVERYRSGKGTDADNLRAVILEASRHVTQTVVSSWNKLFGDKSLSAMRVEIEVGQDDLVGDPEVQPALWVRFRIEDSDGFFTVAERSLGFRWFFVYLMLTTYRGQRRGSSPNMLYLFDEPASNLHPTAQRALLASFGDLSKRAVIVYTTHSHYLIEPTWLGTTSVVSNVGLGEDAVSTTFTSSRTDIRVTPYHRFASQHPAQSHYFQPIREVLEYSPSAIDFVPDAVMVEGKSDYYLLEYYQRVIQRVTDERLALMPGGGAGTLDSLIQLYLGWARPFVALLDSDKQGRAERDRYIKKFGPIIEPHLVLLAEAANDEVKGVESLLSREDMLAFQRILDPDVQSVHKKAFTLGVQEALVRGTIVPLSAEARQRLDSVLGYLREKTAAA